MLLFIFNKNNDAISFKIHDYISICDKNDNVKLLPEINRKKYRELCLVLPVIHASPIVYVTTDFFLILSTMIILLIAPHMKNKIDLGRCIHLFKCSWKCDIIMGAMASQITSLTIFTQPFIQAQITETIKAPHHWSLCGEFTGHRWIPSTNGR